MDYVRILSLDGKEEELLKLLAANIIQKFPGLEWYQLLTGTKETEIQKLRHSYKELGIEKEGFFLFGKDVLEFLHSNYETGLIAVTSNEVLTREGMVIYGQGLKMPELEQHRAKIIISSYGLTEGLEKGMCIARSGRSSLSDSFGTNAHNLTSEDTKPSLAFWRYAHTEKENWQYNLLERLVVQALHELGEVKGLKEHRDEPFPLVEGKLCPMTYAGAFMEKRKTSSRSYLENVGTNYCEDCYKELRELE